MDSSLSALSLSVTKPKGKIAIRLAELGCAISPVEEDEGNVDRYIVSKRLVIERRNASGFLRGIMEKTLFTSAIYLREHFEIPILILEGEINYEYTGFDPQAVRGALSSMMLQYGLSVLCTRNLEETVHLIAMMARQEQIGIPEISLIPKRKAVDLPDMQRRVIEMLPGCGMTMARDLLQRFGSVKRIMEATEEELLSVRGLGVKKVTEILKVLHTEYESVDTEKNLEDAIEACPRLLFEQPVGLLARQHHIRTEAQVSHIVDLVFLDTDEEELILVELKRGKLRREHEMQLKRYLDLALESRLLRSFLAEEYTLRGVLATVEPCDFQPKDKAISVSIIDKQAVLAVLKQQRQHYLNKTEN